MRRRDVLAGAGFVLAGGVALAWSALFGPPDVYVREIKYINFDDEPHSLVIELVEGDAVVFETALDLVENQGTVGEGDRGVVDAALPNAPGQYAVVARAESESGRVFLPDGPPNFDAECVSILVEITHEEAVGIASSVGGGDGDDGAGCEERD
jgi:hypothetical protein